MEITIEEKITFLLEMSKKHEIRIFELERQVGIGPDGTRLKEEVNENYIRGQRNISYTNGCRSFERNKTIV